MVSAVKIQGLADPAERLCFPGRGISVGSDFGWIPRGALSSCTGTYGRYVGMVARLRVAGQVFPSTPCTCSAHGGTAVIACPTEKVANIIGESCVLVSGCVYAGKDCACALRGLAPWLMGGLFVRDMTLIIRCTCWHG